eukprot:TRINITY_DN5742_c0_g1_i1.p1 TRINITY_DN5742_c0_g1~~TRINITY_DN5742_c0_g1_i1.p1  ORF type:complete len:143 (+),score=5.83 TRINITY_DN5742_c0_g1_i1:601-1029(+)
MLIFLLCDHWLVIPVHSKEGSAVAGLFGGWRQRTTCPVDFSLALFLAYVDGGLLSPCQKASEVSMVVARPGEALPCLGALKPGGLELCKGGCVVQFMQIRELVVWEWCHCATRWTLAASLLCTDALYQGVAHPGDLLFWLSF